VLIFSISVIVIYDAGPRCSILTMSVPWKEDCREKTDCGEKCVLLSDAPDFCGPIAKISQDYHLR